MAGFTVWVPEEGTLPMPSMEMSFALVVCQVSATPSPGLTTVGAAVMEAVGAGAAIAGGGGGGGGAAFLLQPLIAATKAKMAREAKY